MFISTAIQSRCTVLEANIYVSGIFFGYLKIGDSTLQAFALDTIRMRQTNKKQYSQLTKSFLGLAWNLKDKNIWSMYKLAKILQTSCFTTFGSSACQGSLSWHVQLPNRPTQISKNFSFL